MIAGGGIPEGFINIRTPIPAIINLIAFYNSNPFLNGTPNSSNQ